MIETTREYIEDILGTDVANDIILCADKIVSHKNDKNKSKYNEALNTYLSFFNWEWDGEDDYDIVDVVLEKNQIMHYENIKKDVIIALIRHGVICISRI